MDGDFSPPVYKERSSWSVISNAGFYSGKGLNLQLVGPANGAHESEIPIYNADMDKREGVSPLSANLKIWRERRGLSASALARKAALAKSTVSELERGKGNPSLDTLWALATALHISLGALFTGPSNRTEIKVQRLPDAPTIARDGQRFVARLMASWTPAGEVEVSMVSLAPNSKRQSRGNSRGIIEHAICIEGPVEVGPNNTMVLLQKGDMVTFLADQPHSYVTKDSPGGLVVVQHYPFAS